MNATVALLTLNADPWLRELLDGVVRQKTDFEYEILLIDSGSTDKTLEVAAEYPDVRLHQIANSDSDTAKTRNLAAELSKADYMVVPDARRGAGARTTGSPRCCGRLT